MKFNKTIQMLIFEGEPNGLIMCEVASNKVTAYKFSRNYVSAFSKRKDSNNTGVYFLFGKDENNNETVYIVESEKTLDRIKDNLKEKKKVTDNYLKNYWNDCIVVISTNNSINKAHVKFLENKFYELAKNSGRATILNGNIPTCSSISEYDEAMLEEFISNTKLLVNTLGYKTFDLIADDDTINDDVKTIFSILNSKGANAKGFVVSDGFAVLKDSIVVPKLRQSIAPSIKRLRDSLYDKGIINNANNFICDHIFTSPSLAAAVIVGGNVNGRIMWKTVDGKTLKEIEEEKLE